MGSDRTEAVASADGGGPRALGRFSARFGTPVAMNLLSGAVATALSFSPQRLEYELTQIVALAAIVVVGVVFCPPGARTHQETAAGKHPALAAGRLSGGVPVGSAVTRGILMRDSRK